MARHRRTRRVWRRRRSLEDTQTRRRTYSYRHRYCRLPCCWYTRQYRNDGKANAFAARDGLEAALLAAAGATASPDALDGSTGFLQTFVSGRGRSVDFA
ncbi:MAG: hypothetical protein EOS83_27250 [Mesorhizobium sp.]|nr:MAG: hypothetical protein EOS83_27250 [Mesorhizobium sp.]